jgi:hypothetical protein
MGSDGEITLAEHWQVELDSAVAEEAGIKGEGVASSLAGAPSFAAPASSSAPISQLLAHMNDVPEGDVGREVSQDAIRLYCLGVDGDEVVEQAVDMGMGPQVH